MESGRGALGGAQLCSKHSDVALARRAGRMARRMGKSHGINPMSVEWEKGTWIF